MGDTPHLHNTTNHHDCCRCSQDQEGRRQAQGPCCPSSLRQHDQGSNQGSRGQEGIVQTGHPEVRLRRLQGDRDCRCCWKEGSWILQAARQGAQGCQEASQAQGQEAQDRCQEEGGQEGSC